MIQPISDDKARELLRAAGLRCTGCRVAVLKYMNQVEAPRSHADVASVLVPQGYDQSTVYRCLIELSDAGFLSRLDLGDHVWRFELRTDHKTDGPEHPHFMCVDCGKVTCLPDVTVKIAPSRGRSAVQGSITEILLKGHCTECD